MKITKQELVEIIKEEVEKALSEQTAYDEAKQKFNKAIGVKSRLDYLVKVVPTFQPGRAGESGKVPKKDYDKLLQAMDLYDDSLYFYIDGQGIFAGILHSLGKK
tara:strand:- start:167 stop:478 length:312 start_codon:yes stop_codon:yes gene_type:complete